MARRGLTATAHAEAPAPPTGPTGSALMTLRQGDGNGRGRPRVEVPLAGSHAGENTSEEQVTRRSRRVVPDPDRRVAVEGGYLMAATGRPTKLDDLITKRICDAVADERPLGCDAGLREVVAHRERYLRAARKRNPIDVAAEGDVDVVGVNGDIRRITASSPPRSTR